jgi:hypothetical protein
VVFSLAVNWNRILALIFPSVTMMRLMPIRITVASNCWRLRAASSRAAGTSRSAMVSSSRSVIASLRPMSFWKSGRLDVSASGRTPTCGCPLLMFSWNSDGYLETSWSLPWFSVTF